MALNFKNFFEGIRVKAKAVLTSDTKGELEVSNIDNKIYYHDGSVRSPVVTEVSTATLTNKTLTSPVINTPTGITKTDIGLSNVDNTSDATKNAAAVTLTNKTITAPLGIVKADVGLSNVDNTSDATKNSAAVSLTNHTIDGSLNTITNVTSTVNANLTGPITSVGNATSIASQTGTGTKFVVDTSPTLVTPNIGAATGISLSVTGQLTSTVAIGTAPLVVTSTTQVSNLYATRAATADTVTTSPALSGAVTSSGASNVTSLGSFTSAQLATALTDETGSGANVFGTSPTITSASIVTPTRLDMKQDTLANLQTYASTAANGQLVFATDTKATYVVKDSALSAVGGGGTPNYILSPDADSGIGLWATYKNASGAATPDGTITGTANSTFAVSASTALRGTSNFLFTKNSGASRQGEGFYYPFTIDNADKGKVLTVSFDYQIDSGTFVDDALEFFIWDVTNSRLIQPAPSKLKNSGILEKFAVEFQTSIDSTSYRLFAHVGVVTNSSNTIRFDNFQCYRQSISYGSAVTDWVSYTPTFVGFGTPAGVAFRSRRVGDTLEILGSFTQGVTTGATASISVGYGGANGNVTIDSSKLSSGIVGSGAVAGNSATFFGISVLGLTGTSNLQFGVQSSTTSGISAVIGSSLWSGAVMQIHASVPIVGWSSSQIMSSDADTREVSAIMNGTPTGTVTSLGGETVAKFPTTIKDTHGGYSAATGLYTVPVSGTYSIDASALITFTLGTPYLYGIIYKNGSAYKGQYFYQASAADGIPKITGDVPCVAGDTLSIHFASNAASPVFSGSTPTLNQFTIKRLSGPAQIAASSIVSFSVNTSTTAATTSAPFIYTVKDHDNFNAYSTVTGKFTAPMAGMYFFTSTNYAGATVFAPVFYKNTTAIANGMNTTANISPGIVSHTFVLLAGDTVEVRINTGTATSSGTATQNMFSGFRVGGVM